MQWRWALIFQFGLLLAQPGLAAQADESGIMDDLLVITRKHLGLLSYMAKCEDLGGIFQTQELRARLVDEATIDSLLVSQISQGETCIIWYTDTASSTPRPLKITRAEHQTLVTYAIKREFVSVQEVKVKIKDEKLVTGPTGAKVVIPAEFKFVEVIKVNAAEVEKLLAEIKSMPEGQSRRALEFLAGAKLAEAFPEGKVPESSGGTDLICRYRQTVEEQAVLALNRQAKSGLDKPLLFGNQELDSLTRFGSLNGLIANGLVQTKAGDFGKVWQGSVLTLVPEDLLSDNKDQSPRQVRLSETNFKNCAIKASPPEVPYKMKK